jgi:hypothetical protein
MPFALAASLLLALWSPSLSADCGDDPNNKLQSSNCDFDTDPATGPTWSGATGVLSHNTTDGYPPAASPGSGYMSAADLGGLWATSLSLYGNMSAPTCFPITFTGTEATIGIYLRQISGTASCSLNANFYPGANCSGALVDTCTTGFLALSGNWTQFSCEATSLDNTIIGMVLSVGCGLEAAPFQVGHDNAFVIEGTGAVPVELQSFSIE